MSQDQSILIVEDESIVALDLKVQLIDLGYEVQGIAASADQAFKLVAQRVPTRQPGRQCGVQVEFGHN